MRSPGDTPQHTQKGETGAGWGRNGPGWEGARLRGASTLSSLPQLGSETSTQQAPTWCRLQRTPGDLGPPSVWLEEASRPGGWLSRVVTTGRGWGGHCRVA